METRVATIVVIDDDLSVRDIVSRVLRLKRHQVLAFEDGSYALAEVDFDEVDLLITDLRMPTPGEQVIATLQDKGVRIPTIVISGCVDDTLVHNLTAMGVKKILEKPFHVPELLELVQNCISEN